LLTRYLQRFNMKLQHIQFFCLVAFACICVSKAETVRCYACTNTDNPACGEGANFDPSDMAKVGQINCTSGVCAKQVMSFSGASDLTRRCGSADDVSKACVKILGISTCVYTCKSDLCNSAGSITYTLAIILTSLAFTMLRRVM